MQQWGQEVSSHQFTCTSNYWTLIGCGCRHIVARTLLLCPAAVDSSGGKGVKFPIIDSLRMIIRITLGGERS